MAEHFEGGIVDGTEFFDLAVRHAGVGGGFSFASETRFLDGAGLQNAFKDRRGRFSRTATGEFLEGHCRRFDMDVDAIEERTGDAVAVALDLDTGAAALALRVAVKSARAGIHRGDENKFGRKCHGSSRTGYGHLAILDWLAHDLERGAFEFRQFIEEEDAVVGNADLARRWVCGSTEESDIADGVVRRAEGAFGNEGVRLVEQTTNAMDLGGFDRLIQSHRRNDRGNPLSQHALAGAGRADQQEIMSTGHGNLDGALDLMLAFDLGKIDIIGRARCEALGGTSSHGGEFFFAGEKFVGLAEVFDAIDLDPLDDCRLGGIRSGEDHGLHPLIPCSHGNGKGAFDWANLAGEGEFANDEAALKSRQLGALGCGDHTDGNRQIEARAFFFDVSRSEVDSRPLARPAEAAVGNGCGDAVLALAHGGIGKSNDNHHRVAGTGIDLHLHLDGFNALQRGREHASKHAGGCIRMQGGLSKPGLLFPKVGGEW